MTTLAALDLLSGKKTPEIPPVIACFGDDDFLRRVAREKLRELIFSGEDDFDSRRIAGRDAQLADILDELRTLSLFAAGRRMVTVEDADDFVSKHRPALESYAAKPSSAGLLILDVRTWPKTTRLYKAIDKAGLQIDCSSPKPAALRGWLGKWAQARHGVKLEGSASEMLIETIGPEVGLLDQELAKLSGYACGSAVTGAMVRELVGGWRTKTTWEMLDAALAGDARAAFQQLDRLLASGEHPVALLGPIGFTLRRFAAAARTIDQTQQRGKRITVRDALQQAGVKSFVLAKSESQLRQVGPRRAGMLDAWLLDADLALKGASQLRPRVVLERLVCRLSKTALPSQTR